MKQDDLRKKTIYLVKVLKESSYREIAEDLLCIKYESFINYLNGQYDLSTDKANQLDDWISDILY